MYPTYYQGYCGSRSKQNPFKESNRSRWHQCPCAERSSTSNSLALIYNASIRNGVFPAAFKIAKVYCHSTRETQYKRKAITVPYLFYLYFPKPLKRHIASANLQHLTPNNLLTALLNISDNWLKAMDNSELAGIVFLDLSKAFDLVNHDILLAKLDKYYTGTNTMDWFRSYLTGRTQVVSLSGVLSSPFKS